MSYQTLFTELEIKNKVGEIAHYINKQSHDNPPIFICVLNGAFMFFTDLVKHINDCEIDFIRAKSYNGMTQGNIEIIKSIETNIEGRDVYLVDEMYDSGNTIKALITHLKQFSPKSITPVTLFKKWHSNHPELVYGFELEGESWLVGYGLDDEKGLNRNLKHVVGIPRED